MRNTIIFATILFVTTIVATIFYFKGLDNEHGQAARPIRLLPENTLLIATIENNQESEGIFDNFEIFDAILSRETTGTWSLFKTKILNNEKIKNFINGNDIFVSFHPEKNEIESLFTIPCTQIINKTDLIGIINSINTDFKTKTIDTLGQKLYEIRYGAKDSTINAIYFNDIFFASKSTQLLLKIADKHTKHLPADQIDFFLKDNPRTTPLSIYFPHQNYNKFVELMQNNNKGPFIDLFKKLQGQSAWNLNFKEDALILNGESMLDQYPENYASIFKNQEKRKQKLDKYFPANTAAYVEFSISNQSIFQKDLNDLFKRRGEKIQNPKDISSSTEILNKSLGDNFAFLETNDQAYIGFIEIKDIKEFQKINTDPQDGTILRFENSGEFYQKFGDAFKEFQRPYYTVIDSVLVIGNSSSILQKYSKNYTENDLLSGNLGYIRLKKLQSKEANITLFAHSKNINSKILNSLKRPFANNYKNKENFGFQDFLTWSMQLSGNAGKVNSQIYAIYKSKNLLGTVPDWTYELNEKAITKPYILEHSDTSKFILIQELDHTIHAISPTGKKIWSKVVAGRIIGDIQQLSDRSITFITDKAMLYKVDTGGKTNDGYPINFQEKPINNLLLTEIKGKKTILIPTSKTIKAYNLNGTLLKDWSQFEPEGLITTDILTNGKQYIFGTTNGMIYWLDESGKKTEQIKMQNAEIINLGLIENYKIAALDNKGYLNLYSDNTNFKKIQLTSDSNKYNALFTNISNDKTRNLAILADNVLNVYDIKDSLNTILTYKFTKPISDPLEQFVSTNNNARSNLGVASKATNLIYVFNEDGNLSDGFPIEGRPLFYYGKINYNSDVYVICTRNDHKIYAFRKQK